jgi:site-specific DNA-methyltransferase (adenine-specific)
VTPRKRDPHDGWKVIEGDCLERLAELPAASVDAIVTDPPYGIDFQDERWDGRAIRDAARQRSGKKLSAPRRNYGRG